MAQAARLNLRMQKELKLLMTDPPPGVSFPFLCDGNSPSSSSLSSIEARIEGPEGTVYSKGVFTIKVQIPERYPFQPPNVTFITPIYHPNIDNGGRICLDILNLPPKGAWQPSLNISTVLTSIGLLLSEPNPDDGLMAETSREYKYNRQAFDQTARLWTEKYANAGENGKSDGSSLPNIDLQPEIEVKTEETSSKDAVIGAEGSRKKLRLNGEKLSLKSKALANINRSDKENEAPIRKLSISHNQKPHLVDSSNSVVPKHVMTLCEESSFHGNDKDLDGNGDGNGKQVEGSPKNIESIIVSDSEESDEDEGPLRSRLFRMRKITGKLHGVNQTL